MKISLSIFGKIKVDDNIHSLNVNPSREKIRTHKISRNAAPKVMENLVSILLSHLGMRVEAGETKFGDFLGQ